MSSSDRDDRPPVQQSRQVTIDALCEHFANDVMSVEEFERRVDVANRATTSDELKELLRDMPGGGDLPAVVGEGAPRPASQRSYSVTDAAHVEDMRFQIAILGASTRKGRWRPGRVNYALAAMGGAELDFREAEMPPGVTTVRVFAMWGGVEIIVPPGMRVESHGIGIMGGFEHSEEGDTDPDPDGPVLRITGAAIMGGVDVTTRYPGESAGEARRRRRLERKERKRLRRGR